MYEQNLNQQNLNEPNLNLEQNKKKNNLTKYLFIFVISLLFVGNVGAFYYIFTNSQNKKAENVINEEQNNQENLNNSTTTEEITLKDGEILVEWSDWPAKQNVWNIFDLATIKEAVENDTEYQSLKLNINNIISDFNVYRVGIITKGEYQGNDLYVIIYEPVNEMNIGGGTMLRVIKNDNNLIVLGKHSEEMGSFYKKMFVINNNISISNLETPETINTSDPNLVLQKNETESYKLMESYNNPEKIFQYDGKNYVYKDQNTNCFIVRANDGTSREYFFNLDFLGKKSSSIITGLIPYLLDITWSDGTKNTNEYIFKSLGGCGVSGCYSYADYVTDNDLKEVGKTGTGDSIYALKDNNFDGKLKLMYDQYYPGYDPKTQKQYTKPSFEQFVGQKPLVFWKDPFGKFIEFKNAKYLPAVECGKPVIYLYPTKTTDVSVKVFPSGGFTITEPAYNSGWFVKATKNSELYNYNDKTVYPYLFWEGHGMNYERPKNGFVVAKSDVEKFLVKTLSQFGLIEKEYNEFIEFWLPKMSSKNYYFITFVPQEQFDKLAPLSINPKPDTIIRVFMDFEGLDNYVSVEPQIIKNTPRIGFTVVEWGGALHK